MAVTMLPAAKVSQSPGEAVVTITVQITVAGDELPAAASRLISDLEALADAGRPAARQVRPLRLVSSVTSDETRDGNRRVLALHTGPRLVFRDGTELSLTRREFDLFQYLCENPRQVFTRSQLLRAVWGYDMVGTERTVDVHVRRL